MDQALQLHVWAESWYGSGELTWLDPGSWFKEGQVTT